jgi:hypothetical protein
MKKQLLIFVFLCAGAIGMTSLKLADTSKSRAIDPEKNYTQYCSSCHGEKVEAFVDRQWKHGKSKNELVASITNGYNDQGMPTWKGILSPEEINQLADLIIENLKTVDQYKFANKPSSNKFNSEGMKIVLDTIATGFDSPWGFAQLPSNDYLITDRAGSLYLVDQKQHKTLIKNTPAVMSKSQGGLLDIVLHPNYSTNGWVYMSYSKFKKEGSVTLTSTAIIRGKIKNNEFVEAQEIFEAAPYTKTFYHFGSRIAFDKKGYLFFSVGERGMEKEFPQETNNDTGKIHRLNDDGSVPKDNPFVGKDAEKSKLFSHFRDAKNVIIKGTFLDQKSIKALHDQNGVFLAISRQDAQGVSMCEAMSSGLAIISSNNTAIPEFIPDYQGGLLSNNTPSDIANKILEIVEN